MQDNSSRQDNSLSNLPKTLIIQPYQGIGDMVWHFPYIRTLAKSSLNGAVTLLTKRASGSEHLFHGCKWIEEIIWLERNPGRHDTFIGGLELVQTISQRKFDRVIIFHTSWRYATIAYLAGIPQRYGYGTNFICKALLNTKTLPSSCSRITCAEKIQALAEMHGFLPAAEDEMLTVSEEAVAAVKQKFSQTLPKPWIIIGIGATEAGRLWPADNFIDLFPYLKQKFPTSSIILLGAKLEEERATYIQAESQKKHNIKVEKITYLPLTQTIALIRASDLYIGNDTSILNLAARSGVDVIGFFGGTPRSLDYSPKIRGLKLPHHNTIASITVQDAIDFIEFQKDLTILAGNNPGNNPGNNSGNNSGNN